MRQKIQNCPIRWKLILVFVCTSLTVAGINIYIYSNLKQAINKIDSVYESNEELNVISDNLANIQTNVTQYLNIKSSDVLEDYYRYEQEYREQIRQLSHTTKGEETALMEKNIYYMSLTYLEKAGDAIEYKRARNIPRYKESYDEVQTLYYQIETFIKDLNNRQLQNNSQKYVLLRNSLNSLVVLSAGILLIVLLFNLLFIIFMTRSITRPLTELAGITGRVSEGEFNVEVPYAHKTDELGILSRAFNKMLVSIRSYIEELKIHYARENEMKEQELLMKNHLKDAQLRYLQAQINPHFLFNTLNAGAQLAMMEGAEKTCLFVENMADFFRYNVQKISKDTSLKEELDLVDNYIYILNVRFSGEIHYEKQIDERFLSIQVPSMILQPIVENAVNHGIRGLERDGFIWLSVYAQDKNVCISVKDNGFGMSEEMIKKILHGESEPSTEEEGDSTGIGMDNVIGRLRNYYEREQVMEIRSDGVDCGTEIIISIPYERPVCREDTYV